MKRYLRQKTRNGFKTTELFNLSSLSLEILNLSVKTLIIKRWGVRDKDLINIKQETEAISLECDASQ